MSPLLLVLGLAGVPQSDAPPRPKNQAGAVIEAKSAEIPASDRPRIVVMPLGVDGELSAAFVVSMTGLITQSLSDLGAFQAISATDVANMLDYEAEKQNLGCTDEVSCLSEVAGAFGADYVVAGTVAHADLWILQLQLLEIKEGAVAARETRAVEKKADLIEVAGSAGRALVRGLLEGRAGTLQLMVSEEGATVEVDRRVVGVSPMDTITLGAGVHGVSVEKRGFVIAQKDVEIREGETTRVVMTLVPSQEFVARYQDDAELVRWTAIGAAGLGGAALAGAGGIWLYGDGLARDVKGRAIAYNEQPIRTEAQRSAIATDVEIVGTLDVITIAAATAGVVSATIGAAMFLLGPDPGRYNGLVE